MEPFKNVFSPDLVRCLAAHLKRCMRGFDAAAFAAAIKPRLAGLGLKARAQLIADQMHDALPADPARRAEILLAMLHPDRLDHADQPSDEDGICGWAIMPLTMLVGQHGIDDFDRSMSLMRELTTRFSAEFGIRYFLLADQPRALAIMAGWIGDPNRHVRRLVSEGTRPRLPWAMQLPALITDPGPVIPLLERLRDDPEPYVRRSVANHLNDISKDHPALVVELAARWMIGAEGEHKALLRHACRTLIKQGQADALAIFGSRRPEIEMEPPRLSAREVRMGETIELSITLRSLSTQSQRLTIDYVLHFLKAGGSRRPKVFKGGNIVLAPGEATTFSRRHAFKEVTTRRHYPGAHGVSFRINGQDTAQADFSLLLDGHS
ncbi:DNA alkylation repair protein [Mesorhizobium sp.]|uniref:DNA alkylation repair protein n=1 Tax=Mesorhizobium sp. TaxID=1871066 RepID=UPI000FE538D4|nr:DNA alkylation repair protein [Mesorhizobium sp.]RWA69606.1 MAG: DNA alkylation repair protein [Mesorhizobium sp.]RWA78451.1 MAG: DNA alkylation repair protein [Mesorhizobium sp.]